MLTNGIYYLPSTDTLIILSKVENYEDLNSEFSIVTWEHERAIVEKVLITNDQYKRFIFIGEL